jgi:hypothetical protein
MLKRITIFLLALSVISFGIYALSLPVNVNFSRPHKGLFYRHVCCGSKCVFDYCAGKGSYSCCIIVMED